ncbi:molybdopterin cofactor-binding domain-containing protein [Fodinicurvata fenggangensis]|uniref:molybdopterin cofactor-binding domain-containing protein n=1 Tax=Fodinicurvata fenggangensis TaxID=1121830 RepID=UPI00047BC5B4|nr:molybdopterin cofactor-binding domain-containing protein [Fodinicurvata fenggangensis]
MGRAINPRAIQGQIQGGVVQGLGYALHEEVTLPPDGRIPQSGFETYRLPQAGDAVPVQIDLYEGAPSLGPLGAKGAGEIPILNVAAAVACAVANATGRRVQEIPLTPPRVLDLLCGEGEALDLSHMAEDWRGNVLENERGLWW